MHKSESLEIKYLIQDIINGLELMDEIPDVEYSIYQLKDLKQIIENMTDDL